MPSAEDPYIPRMNLQYRASDNASGVVGAMNDFANSLKQFQVSRSIQGATNEIQKMRLNGENDNAIQQRQNELSQQLGQQMVAMGGFPVSQVQMAQQSLAPNIQQQAEQQKAQGVLSDYDPNSEVASQLRKNYTQYGAKYGIDPSTLEGMSPAEMKGYVQPLLDHAERIAQIRSERDLAFGDKQDKRFDDNLAKTRDAMNSLRGHPAVQQADRDLYSSQKINDVFGSYKNPNDIPSNIKQGIAADALRIMSGQAPTHAEMEGVNLIGAPERLSRLASIAMNKPEGAEAGAFIREFQKFGNTISQGAKSKMQEHYGTILRSSKRLLRPDDYDTLNKEFIGKYDVQSAKQYDADVMRYAKKWGISPEQAQAQKDAHKGGS